MKSMDDYIAEIAAASSEIWSLKLKIKALRQEMAEQYAPVKVGWIIEDTIIRIQVKSLDHWYDNLTKGYWIASGIVLTKANLPDVRFTGLRNITIHDLDSLRNTVRIIKKH